jgi:hypothetical protein
LRRLQKKKAADNITQQPATGTEVKEKGQESLKFVPVILARLLCYLPLTFNGFKNKILPFNLELNLELNSNVNKVKKWFFLFILL